MAIAILRTIVLYVFLVVFRWESKSSLCYSVLSRSRPPYADPKDFDVLKSITSMEGVD